MQQEYLLVAMANTLVLNHKFLKALTLCLAVFVAVCISSPSWAKSNQKYASIVVDTEHGIILHQRYADKKLHPASLVKMMTLVLTFEALDSRHIFPRQRIEISKHAASMVPSKLNLPVGSTIKVEDAILALVTKSANDVAVALAEALAGSEKEFAAAMNKRARSIGMTRTNFTNASGLHDPNQYTTARDMAILARYLVVRHQKYYHYFSTKSFTYQGKTYRNHNKLLSSYKGMDGLKTGYIRKSGFNLAASAQRGDVRLIGIVFGGKTGDRRNAHMASLLDKGFAKMSRITVAAIKRPAPLPQQKPDMESRLASAMNNMAPAAGITPDIRVSWDDLAPIISQEAVLDLVGQGDYDDDMAARVETGLMSIASLRVMKNLTETPIERLKRKKAERAAAVAETGVQQVAYTPPTHIQHADENWAIQVGAFKSREKITSVIQNALVSLPGYKDGEYEHVKPVISPVKTHRGWLYRGRIKGFTKRQALEACFYLRDCIPLAPDRT